MPDKYSPKPRIVVYLDPKEMAAAEKKAKAADHKNAHRWGTAVIRKALQQNGALNPGIQIRLDDGRWVDAMTYPQYDASKQYKMRRRPTI